MDFEHGKASLEGLFWRTHVTVQRKVPASPGANCALARIRIPNDKYTVARSQSVRVQTDMFEPLNGRGEIKQ